jgi:hypothetical protein
MNAPWPWLALAATVTALDTALALWWGRRSRNAEVGALLARLASRKTKYDALRDKLATADQACADRSTHIDSLTHEMAAVCGERDKTSAGLDIEIKRRLDAEEWWNATKINLTTALAERDAALRDAEGWQAAQTLQSGVVREWIAECTALRATVADLRAGKAAGPVGKRLPRLRTPDGRFAGSRMGAGTDWRALASGLGRGDEA